MERYLAGTSVKATISLTDRFGNKIEAVSVEYEVLDQTGATKVERTPVTGFDPTEDSFIVTVPASANSVTGTSVPREMRRVTAYLKQADNSEIPQSVVYAVERDDPLIVGINSFQTLDGAEMTSMDIAVPDDWDMADEKDKIRALIDARNRICTLSFDLSVLNRQMNDVSFIPEGVSLTGTRMSLWSIKGNLSELTIEQFNNLPPIFLRALREAQVMDAVETLAPDKVAKKRMQGLILDTIGETKQMFTSARPVESAASKGAMKILSRFLTSTITLGRA